MKIHESAENYLETIWILQERNGQVRSIDIVNEINFTKPSVSYAMKQFRKNGYVEMDDNGFIELTEAGREIARQVYERHQLLTRYLVSLGVSGETARADACRMEHVLSQESIDKIKEHAKKSGVWE